MSLVRQLSYQPLTLKAWVCPMPVHVAHVVDIVTLGQVASPSTLPVSIISSMLHTCFSVTAAI